MPAVGSFLANMLLGGLQEGQRRREAQTTVLPHLLNLMATMEYHRGTLELGKEKEGRLERESESKLTSTKPLSDSSKSYLGKIDQRIEDIQLESSPFFGEDSRATRIAALRRLKQQRLQAEQAQGRDISGYEDAPSALPNLPIPHTIEPLATSESQAPQIPKVLSPFLHLIPELVRRR